MNKNKPNFDRKQYTSIGCPDKCEKNGSQNITLKLVILNFNFVQLKLPVVLEFLGKKLQKLLADVASFSSICSSAATFAILVEFPNVY